MGFLRLFCALPALLLLLLLLLLRVLLLLPRLPPLLYLLLLLLELLLALLEPDCSVKYKMKRVFTYSLSCGSYVPVLLQSKEEIRRGVTFSAHRECPFFDLVRLTLIAIYQYQ